MKGKEKRTIYALSSIILAVIVFLFSLFFTETKDVVVIQMVSPEQSSSPLDSSNSPADSSEDGGGGGKPIIFTILTDQSQYIYLRQDSKGGYTGKGYHGFIGDETYYLENPTDLNPLYYLGQTLQINNRKKCKAEIELLKVENDLLPYGLKSKKDGEKENVYTVDYYPFGNFSYDLYSALTPMTSKAEYATQEKLYYDFVVDTYLSIPSTLKTTLLSLAKKNNLNASSDTIIYDVAHYIQNAAYYDFKYTDESYPYDKDMVTYFLTEHKRGVCRHFAAAATMMFRALGIPARYAIGFSTWVDANEKLEYKGEGHAWTEIYLQGYGWVPVEVTGSTVWEGEE